ncbi:MAG: hypothetical protein M9953_06410 [Thermomicrobiales bacterium]|nr:hypothetical protein [Thermomicrobiales bacterium]MCO5218261.1 hypothetical protein [Thermomicrobiales bacterium]MCO5224952.1 hypothetical protein [Thermomicrobiales bacterium]
MRRHSQLPEYIRLIALLAFGLVFGHDLLMASAAHQPEDPHADHIAVEQCGPTEGVLAQIVMLPIAHPSAVFFAESTSAPDLLATFPGEDQVEFLADASARRAMLQVFLN